MKLIPILIILSYLFSCTGCSSVPIDSIGFCYKDEGKEYCGDIGFNKQKSDESGGVVVDQNVDGKTEQLYTFNEEELQKIEEKLSDDKTKVNISSSPNNTYKNIKNLIK